MPLPVCFWRESDRMLMLFVGMIIGAAIGFFLAVFLMIGDDDND